MKLSHLRQKSISLWEKKHKLVALVSKSLDLQVYAKICNLNSEKYGSSFFCLTDLKVFFPPCLFRQITFQTSFIMDPIFFSWNDGQFSSEEGIWLFYQTGLKNIFIFLAALHRHPKFSCPVVVSAATAQLITAPVCFVDCHTDVAPCSQGFSVIVIENYCFLPLLLSILILSNWIMQNVIINYGSNWQQRQKREEDICNLDPVNHLLPASGRLYTLGQVPAANVGTCSASCFNLFYIATLGAKCPSATPVIV